MADPGWVLDSLVSLINSPPWKCLVDNFIDENCLVFDNQDLSQFAYTEVHERYQKLVEGQLEMLMGFLGISAEQFLAAMTKATAPNSEHKALFIQIQAAEDYVVFKKMMEQRNLELNQQAMARLQQHSTPSDRKDTTSSAAVESKEKEAEEEELLEALRRSKEEFEEGLSRGLSVEEREMEEEELQQALKRSMEEYNQSQITTAQPPPPSQREDQETEPLASRQTQPEPSPPAVIPSPDTSVKPHAGSSSQATDSAPRSSHKPSLQQPPPAVSSRVPLPTVSAPPAVQTGADAAAEWLASARAEASRTSIPAPTTQSLGDIDIKQRQAYLRKQRDELVARNQRQRKKDLATYTASISNTPAVTTAAAAATSSPTHQLQKQQPVLCSALADKLSDQ